MAYDPGAIEAALAAAVGDDPSLIAELRIAFVESAQAALAAMEASEDVAGWTIAAHRLQGLAASFGAVRLMVMAAEAAKVTPGDPATIRKLTRAVARL
ncbi:MAG TPA: Hpt domain-containing protein [Sphingomonas sp.]|jgi:HPt (histidine-containing phosphotransfer) domain-containing protein